MHRASGLSLTTRVTPGCSGRRPSSSLSHKKPVGLPAPVKAGFFSREMVTSRLLAGSLLGLSLAVVLWGTGYKLSLYRPHPSPAVRVSAAKLWVGPQETACVSRSHTKVTTPSTPVPQPLGIQSHISTYDASSKLTSSVASALGARLRFLSISLRSPPLPKL
jgi:hypothetical protein